MSYPIFKLVDPRVEIKASTSIDQAAKALTRLSRDCDQRIDTTFNDIRIAVFPKDSYQDVIAQYEAEVRRLVK